MGYPKIEDLIGKTLVRVENRGDEQIIFVTDTGEQFTQYHSQDCCESVTIEEIVGDLDDLVGGQILLAEEVTHSGTDGDNGDWPADVPRHEYEPESYTWTFYKLATVKGSVTIRWFGSSNGYYSESVSFTRGEPE